MADYVVKPLVPETWDAFATLAAAHNGVWGGCWCMGFHEKWPRSGVSGEMNREEKQARVLAGTTHAALVFDGDKAVGWCQYGPTRELPRINSRREYEKTLKVLPDWRITCFFTGTGHRKHGVADAALAGAVDLIAQAGGGRVEGYPEDTTGRKVSNSFLHTGPLSLFERHGFARDRRIANHRWVVTRDIEPA